ncbi:class E sortase [Microbacterium mangrovi]|uniref:class E sortase n=1 Tax=Microbacterium mangrovi TaxID=1348253 RepID=UPI00068F66BA|nr:class E sortase [Microbacterium mangrovi]
MLGEILLTLGVLVLLFVAWQLWIGDWIGAAQKDAAGARLSQRWAAEAGGPTPTASPGTAGHPGATASPPALPQPANAQIFATMHVPRFGADYDVPLAGGTTRAATLDPIGIGHYDGTPMPGQLGNMAVAAHRTTFGKPFNKIATLHVGDAIVIETKAGWYTYRFRTLEYVKPDAYDVTDPVPQQTGVAANGRYLTMTSCSPMYFKTERIVAYSVFESFTPRSAGAPASLDPVRS